MSFVERARTITCGALCHYGLRIFNKMWHENSGFRVCPLCNKKIELDDDMYIVVNNTKLFPNCLIHAKCIQEPSSVEGLTWMNFNKATEYMYENYQEYRSKYKAWI